MAKRRNKAAKIRALIDERPDATAKEIVEALAAQRTRVTAAQVYNVKSSLGKSGPSRGKSGPSRGKSDPYAALIQAKKLAAALGGIEPARQALDLLAKLT